MLRKEKYQRCEGCSSLPLAKQLEIAVIQSRVQENSANLRFFRWAFGGTLLLTFGVVYLQGSGKFHWSDGIIYALCTATVGQLAGLFVLVLRQKK